MTASATAQPADALQTEIRVFRHLGVMVQAVVGANTAGITHHESLVSPSAGGNCLNWVMGHLLWTYNAVLPRLGQQAVMPAAELERYRRGGDPIESGGEAMDFGKLMAAWNEATARVDAGMAALTSRDLDGPGVQTGSPEPDSTFRESLTTLLFHQAYHGGQTAVLRRVAGREGAIR